MIKAKALGVINIPRAFLFLILLKAMIIIFIRLPH